MEVVSWVAGGAGAGLTKLGSLAAASGVDATGVEAAGVEVSGVEASWARQDDALPRLATAIATAIAKVQSHPLRF